MAFNPSVLPGGVCVADVMAHPPLLKTAGETRSKFRTPVRDQELGGSQRSNPRSKELRPHL
eukprot:7707037-Pyramimonas_sp.AAC.1